MAVTDITSKIKAVGAVDWDRRLFDELIPLPQGTTYNSYLILGSEKTALIDTVDPTKADELFANLEEAGVKKIDYIVAHHGEQDHSGSLPAVLAKYPGAKILTDQRCKDLLKDLLMIADDRFEVIADKQVVSLGDKTLEFISTPWVHWPETFCTFIKEDQILFSCDFFGSHLASSAIYAEDAGLLYRSAKRYFAEIMMPFRVQIRKNLERLSAYQIKTIAPSHGPVHRDPKVIMEAYQEWVSDKVKNEVVIPYVSMHGSTTKIVDHFIRVLTEKGVVVKPYFLSKTDIGELAMDLVDAATVVLAGPTVLAAAHPLLAHAAFLANALRPKTRFVSIIGSYGWGGKMVEQLSAMIPNLKVEVIPPVMFMGYPKEADFKAVDAMAEAIVAKHKEIGI